MRMEWLPLELWRASSLAQETKTCEAAYERLSKSGANSSQLATLRRSIEHRIDELETFFIENLDDERAVLFEKQVRDHASAAAAVCTPVPSCVVHFCRDWADARVTAVRVWRCGSGSFHRTSPRALDFASPPVRTSRTGCRRSPSRALPTAALYPHRAVAIVAPCVACRVNALRVLLGPPVPFAAVQQQRLKLRKLLHEYDSTADKRAASGPAPSSAAAPAPTPAVAPVPAAVVASAPAAAAERPSAAAAASAPRALGRSAGVGAEGPPASSTPAAAAAVVGSGAGLLSGGEGAYEGGADDDDAGAGGDDSGAGADDAGRGGKGFVRLNNAARLLQRVRGAAKASGTKKAPVAPIYEWERRALKKESGSSVADDDSDDDLPLAMDEVRGRVSYRWAAVVVAIERVVCVSVSVFVYVRLCCCRVLCCHLRCNVRC